MLQNDHDINTILCQKLIIDIYKTETFLLPLYKIKKQKSTMKLTNFVIVASATACIPIRSLDISEGAISWPEAAARMMNAFGHGKK